ncbi:MAG: hypothetical protein QM731_07970 [Chitinophagaceae bacterium]
MKPETFVILFCILFTGAYIAYSQRDNFSKDQVSIVFSGDDYYEQIKYSGTIKISDDETTITSISAGGRLKYTHDNEQVTIQSDKDGKISYSFNGSKPQYELADKDKKFVAEAIHEMIAIGFDAKARMEKLYAAGGDSALLKAFDELKADHVKSMYLKRLLNDSTSNDKVLKVLQKTASFGADYEKVTLLKNVNEKQLADTAIMHAYFSAINSLGADYDKVSLLEKLNEKQLADTNIMHAFFTSVAGLGADYDKSNLLKRVIEQPSLSKAVFDNVLSTASTIGADYDKMGIYEKLVVKENITTEQWTALINAAARLGADYDKSNLLVRIANKMPVNENTRSAYVQAAKTISSESDYAKAVKPIL